METALNMIRHIFRLANGDLKCMQPTLALHLLRRSCLSPCVIDPQDAIAGRHPASEGTSVVRGCGEGPELNLELVEDYPKAYLYLAARKRWHRSDPISNVVGALCTGKSLGVNSIGS